MYAFSINVYRRSHPSDLPALPILLFSTEAAMMKTQNKVGLVAFHGSLAFLLQVNGKKCENGNTPVKHPLEFNSLEVNLFPL